MNNSNPLSASTNVKAASTSTAAPRLKLVVRRLPPTLPEDVFWKSVTPWLGDVADEASSKISWKRYVKGRPVDDTNQHRILSRAYVQMKSAADLAAFAHAYDGHVFRSKDGQEFQAVVEFAPAQKIPVSKSKPRVDARQGTIDSDPDFLSFMELLRAPIVKQDISVPEVRPEQPKSTPLLDHLREVRQAKKAPAASSSANRSGQALFSDGKGKDKGKGKENMNGKGSKGNKTNQQTSKEGGKQQKKDGNKRQAPPHVPLPAQREDVKIQTNPARQGVQAGQQPGKMQILQRAGGQGKPSGNVNVTASGGKPPSRSASPLPLTDIPKSIPPVKLNKPNAPTKGKGEGTRQRPGAMLGGGKALLSAALNASQQQSQNRAPSQGGPQGGRAVVEGGDGANKDDSAEKRKRTRTRGGAGKKKDAGNGPATETVSSARIDD